MTSFFSKLFGSTPKPPASPAREEPVSYNALSIISAPEKTDDGNWRLRGHIAKTNDSGSMERTFVRADSFASREQAIEFTLRKGQQIIDQQSDTLFASGEPTGRV